MSERKLGHSKLVYDKTKRTIVAVDPHPMTSPPERITEAHTMTERIEDKIFGLSSGARETMRCLFFHGPTEDGNIPCKAGRGELFKAGLARHRHGFAWLTDEGVRVAIEVYQLDDQKDRWERQRRTAR